MKIFFSKTIAALMIALLALSASMASAFTIDDLFDSGPSENGNGKYVQLEATLKDGFDITGSLAWSPDGRYIASAGYVTKSLHIWDVQKKTLAKDIKATVNQGYDKFSLAWSPDGQYLATCFGELDTSLRVYETTDWHVVREFLNSDFLCEMVRYADDGKEIAAIRGDKLATINAKTWEISRVLALPEHGIDKEAPNWTDISYVPGTHSLAMAGYRSEKRKEGDPCAVPGIGEMPSVSARIWFISPSDTGFSNSLSVSCSAPGAQSAEHIRFHPKKQQFAVNAYMATDGSRQIYILNYPDGNLLQTIYSKTIDGTLGVIRYTPDGKYLLIGIDRPPSRHGQLDIVDADTGSIVDSIRVAFHNNEIAVNAQSTAFAVATGDGIKIWKLLPR